MNRLEKRSAILSSYGKDFSILDVCLAVHGAACGSGDWYAAIDRDVRFLRCCLETWDQPACNVNSDFDNCVRVLIKITIREYEICMEVRQASDD